MIRPITKEDRNSFLALPVAAGLFPAEAADFLEKMLSDYFGGHKEAGHACVIDEENGKAVGVAYYQPALATAGTWYLTMIAVDAARQGTGRGSALMRHVEAELAAAGQRILLVETSGIADFALTRRFYAKCGYHEEARVRDYYNVDEDMVLFRKVL